MMDIAHDRTRRQILTLDPQLLLTAIESGRWLRLTADLPADAEVQSVHGDWETSSIRVTVWSASFPPTPAGAIPPTLGPVTVEMRSEISALPLQALVEAGYLALAPSAEDAPGTRAPYATIGVASD